MGVVVQRAALAGEGRAKVRSPVGVQLVQGGKTVVVLDLSGGLFPLPLQAASKARDIKEKRVDVIANLQGRSAA